jgi:chromosome partitioning protein
MDSSQDRHDLHKIVVLNPKGGSGKTTLATNIASLFAKRGPPPTLIDCDPHGFSMQWLNLRPAARPKIYGVAAYDHCTESGKYAKLRAWPGSKQLIVDLPAALPDDQLYYQTYDANSILIPVLPSAIDIHYAARFIANLLLVAQFDRSRRTLAVVANRTRENTLSCRRLTRFLTSLEIPLIARLRDSQNFVHAAANGVGIHEMPGYRVRQDVLRMEAIVEWLDNWRMRRLDAVASADFEHAPRAEVLTPVSHKHPH